MLSDSLFVSGFSNFVSISSINGIKGIGERGLYNRQNNVNGKFRFIWRKNAERNILVWREYIQSLSVFCRSVWYELCIKFTTLVTCCVYMWCLCKCCSAKLGFCPFLLMRDLIREDNPVLVYTLLEY